MQKGFTLIELIIAFAVFGLLTTGVTLGLTAVIRSTAQTALQAKVRNEGEYLMETVSQRVRYSSDVVCNNPTNDTLVVNSVINSESSTFYCDSPNAALERDALNPANKMNSDQVVITNCSFICSPTTGDANSVNVQFSVRDKGLLLPALLFDTDIVLRNK